MTAVNILSSGAVQGLVAGLVSHLEHGDSIELEVEKIGILRNKVERQDA